MKNDMGMQMLNLDDQICRQKFNNLLSSPLKTSINTVQTIRYKFDLL